MTRCENAKLDQHDQCRFCGDAMPGKCCFAKLTVKRPSADDKTYTIFKSDLVKLVNLRDLSTYKDENDLLNDTWEQLPVTAKGILEAIYISIHSAKHRLVYNPLHNSLSYWLQHSLLGQTQVYTLPIVLVYNSSVLAD